MFPIFLLSSAQRLACDDGRFGEAMLIGIDDQALTALNPDLLEDRGQIMAQAATLSQKELVNIPTSSRNITHLSVTEPGVRAPLPDRSRISTCRIASRLHMW